MEHVIKRLPGRILVDKQMITNEQLEIAVQLQAEQRAKRIGSIMIEEDMINRNQLDESLNRQKEKNLRIGELLIEAGYITREQCNRALQIQKDFRTKKLGQILVDLKYLTPNDICIALASQLGCAWVDLSAIDIQPETLSLLPADIMKKFDAVPVEKKEDGLLVVATTQPQDPEIRKELSRLTPWKIELVIAYDGYISAILKNIKSP